MNRLKIYKLSLLVACAFAYSVQALGCGISVSTSPAPLLSASLPANVVPPSGAAAPTQASSALAMPSQGKTNFFTTSFDWVKQNPIKSLSAGVGIGAVVYYIAHRNSKWVRENISEPIKNHCERYKKSLQENTGSHITTALILAAFGGTAIAWQKGWLQFNASNPPVPPVTPMPNPYPVVPVRPVIPPPPAGLIPPPNPYYPPVAMAVPRTGPIMPDIIPATPLAPGPMNCA